MNLNELPSPEIVEELNLSEIVLAMKNKLRELCPEFTGYLESDPILKLLELCAYRELLLRQRINQGARANLLAYAVGGDLDNLSVFYGITRKKGETDSELRERTRAKIEGWSTAGSKEAYIYHAINSDMRVKEANADSPEMGLVRIAILSKENDGEVSAELLESVNDYMQREDIRMLTDTVQVVPCELLDLNIVAKIDLTPGTPPEFLETIKEKIIAEIKQTIGLGVSITRSWIISKLFLGGVKDVQLITPSEDINVAETQCIRLLKVELSCR